MNYISILEKMDLICERFLTLLLTKVIFIWMRKITPMFGYCWEPVPARELQLISLIAIMMAGEVVIFHMISALDMHLMAGRQIQMTWMTIFSVNLT